MRMDDGSWLVSGHREIRQLLHDPRSSAGRLDPQNKVPKAARSLLLQDPPLSGLMFHPDPDDVRGPVQLRVTLALLRSTHRPGRPE